MNSQKTDKERLEEAEQRLKSADKDIDTWKEYARGWVEEIDAQRENGWPSPLSGVPSYIPQDVKIAEEVIYFKNLTIEFAKLISSKNYERNDEITLSVLIGKALYSYLNVSALSSSDKIELIDMVVTYLNSYSKYIVVKSHGLNRNYDNHFHELAGEYGDMDKVRLTGFLIFDKNNNKILRKAMVDA
jgi:hypothetical protein